MNPLLRSLRPFAAILSLSFCGFLRADDLIVISPHPDEIKEETARAFSAWHRQHFGAPANIRWREPGGGTSQMIRYLLAEYKTNPAPGIDVVYGGGVDPFVALEQAGLLTRYDLPPDILAYTEKRWPKYLSPPKEWVEPNVSSFEVYARDHTPKA